jgi:CheY-like chemotaxis protein
MENEGYDVLSAANGVEGIEAAENENPDLTLLDILMQKKDGLTTYGGLKQNKELKTTPVKILTSVNERIGFNFSSDDMGTYNGEEPEAFLNKLLDSE